MIHDPLVSICIPVYNCEKYISQAINSALNQEYKNIEIIVVDNNSSDATVKIVEQFLPFGVKLIKNKTNIGMGGNWNKCIKISRGEFIKILPADDLITENCIKEQVQAFNSPHGKISIVSCPRIVIDENGKYLIKRVNNNLIKKRVIKRERVIELLFRSATNIIGEPGAVLLRRDDVISCGKFNEDAGFLIDLEYWVRILKYGDLYYMDNPMSSFRISIGSESVKIIDKQSSEAVNFFKKLYKENPKIRLLMYIYALVGIYVNVVIKYAFYKLFIKTK